MADAGPKGLVFDVQRFSAHDGPGIRTTVFFQGCGLRCAWCHNPEGFSAAGSLRYLAGECLRCGACVTACPAGAHALADGGHRIRFERCRACGACVHACPAGALARCRAWGAGELLEIALRDRAFYGETGGLTCSGGECLLQPDFAAELLRRARAASLRTAVDTAGHVEWRAFEAVLPYTDLFLYDVKCADPALHRRWTGADNRLVLDNLARLARRGARYWLRIPLIPGVNDSVGELEAVAALIDPIPPPKRVCLIPYHVLGQDKYPQVGLEPGYAPSRPLRDLKSLAEPFLRRGLPMGWPNRNWPNRN
jgi:pyruvate formate lyase activating enzyme